MKRTQRSPSVGLLILLMLAGVACDDDAVEVIPLSVAGSYENTTVDFSTQVLPLLERRCVLCHACYDAPCQLQLSSLEGLSRGIHADKVYDAMRLIAAPPTRLFIDAQETREWRERGFSPVLPSQNDPRPDEKGLIDLVLRHKQAHPLPLTDDGRLQDVFDLSLNRSWHCPSPEDYADYVDEKPFAGMPFALPALAEPEQALISAWIGNGAPMTPPKPADGNYRKQIERWERFFNQESLKARLAARYIYEHLYLANLYFPELSASSYFKLRRSLTPPGVAFRPVATRRPFDDPGSKPVYYRLQPLKGSVVAKTHMPYALDERRLQRFNELFLDIDYPVSALPGYNTEVASNPFSSFAQIPVESRYRFMLEHAEFTIRGFMKGSVCRGQVALNVIDDHFWVLFVSPEHESLELINQLATDNAELLSLPAEAESEAEPLVNWLRFSRLQQKYLGMKTTLFNDYLGDGRHLDMDYIWDGDGKNENALLTIFRHFDSASVRKGLYGSQPKTAWLIDYPVLERIHYLLVAGFDVYGNLGHQLLTRLYMDFLRMESQFNFLTLMPVDARSRLRDHWYRGASQDISDYLQGDYAYNAHEPGIKYRSQQPKRELFDLLRARMSNIVNRDHDLQAADLPSRQIAALHRIAELQGTGATLMPEFSLLLISGENPRLVSLLRSSAHSNVSELFDEASRRIPEEDRIVVMSGVVGAYPDALWQVDASELTEFSNLLGELKDEQGYRQLMRRYGIRRSNDKFWTHSDTIHALYRTIDPINFGLLDYSRLENR